MKSELPIGKIYASDLAGASCGCLIVLAMLELLNAPSAIILTGSVGGLAAFSYFSSISDKNLSRKSVYLACLILMIAILNSSTRFGIRPMVVKDRLISPSEVLYEEWNSFSHVSTSKRKDRYLDYWGPSPSAPRKRVPQYIMQIDGGASTTLCPIEEIELLRYDVTNIVYYIRNKGEACIIGVGAGRDVQAALWFGLDRIVGLEINPIFIKMLKNEFREFAGIADRKEVELVHEEARSYLSRTEETFSVIQMSLTDTWAATGAGAFALCENGLYTTDAWKIFFQRLSPDGIFSVSRWHSSKNIGEMGRVLSLGTAMLLELGVKNPHEHLVIISAHRTSSLLLSKQPFTRDEVEQLEHVCSRLKFHLALAPGHPGARPLLEKIVFSKSIEELERSIEDEPLNFKPTTDDDPYFFNMVKFSSLFSLFKELRKETSKDTPASQTRPFVSIKYKMGVVPGNLIANLVLIILVICLVILSIGTIVLPLAIRNKEIYLKSDIRKISWWPACYFCLIGAGFMFIEIALIQRLSVFLGHPIFALSVLLFTIILSAGIGSYLSEWLPLTRSPWMYIYPSAITIMIYVVHYLTSQIAFVFASSPMIVKILISIVVIFPLGMLMGTCFPAGMRMVKKSSKNETPWYWALNGIFGVLCSALAVTVSVYFSISTTLFVGSICYLLLLACIPKMNKII
jgi:hypothetical protein